MVFPLSIAVSALSKDVGASSLDPGHLVLRYEVVFYSAASGTSSSLGAMPASYSANNMIATLEAILIEAMEPRLNRQRGQELEAFEFFQHEDPELKTAKLMTDVASVLAKNHL